MKNPQATGTARLPRVRIRTFLLDPLCANAQPHVRAGRDSAKLAPARFTVCITRRVKMRACTGVFTMDIK